MIGNGGRRWSGYQPDFQSLTADHRFEAVINDITLRNNLFGFTQVADARREPKSYEGHQSKDVIGETSHVGIVLGAIYGGTAANQGCIAVGCRPPAQVGFGRYPVYEAW